MYLQKLGLAPDSPPIDASIVGDLTDEPSASPRGHRAKNYPLAEYLQSVAVVHR